MTRFYDRTRVSPSIPRRLVRDGKWFLLPLYAVLRASDLARKQTDHEGTWRFADHIYRGRPSGRFLVGRALDALLLSLPSARSFRRRYQFVRDQVVRRVPELAEARGRPVVVVSVPCGIPRDLGEAAVALRAIDPKLSAVRFRGLDLDPEALAAAGRLVDDLGVADAFELTHGDAFEPSALSDAPDVLTSTGLGEFLDDEQLALFLKTWHKAVAPGGVLLTSASHRHRLSDYLLRELAELRAHYREPDQVEAMLHATGFADVAWSLDPTGLQSFFVARKPER